MNKIIIKSSGFSLVELAMVMFIVSLLVGGLLVPLATSVEQSERESTQNQLDDIKESLYAYGMVNGRLPCPDCANGADGCAAVQATDPDNINDGVEDLTGAPLNCAELQGNLPWTTLGVDENDAWDQHFTYRVTQDFALEISNVTATAPCVDNADTAFDLCTVGDIDISNTQGGTINVAENVAAIVVSHGKDYAEATQSDHQEENTDDDTDFVYKGFSRDYDNNFDFDDLMIWVSPVILKNRLVLAEKLP